MFCFIWKVVVGGRVEWGGGRGDESVSMLIDFFEYKSLNLHSEEFRFEHLDFSFE